MSNINDKAGKPQQGRKGGYRDKKSGAENRGAREEAAARDIIIGRNGVNEAIKSGRPIQSIYIQRGERQGSILPIISKAKELGITIKEVDSKKLDYMCPGNGNHQGIIASCAVKEFSSLEDIFTLAQERGEEPFIIICDELEDPHNLGAVIRTAECSGAHGVIIPKRRSAGLTYTVSKASAGAVEYVPVVRVTNITDTIKELKEKGLWIYVADMDGQPWCEPDYTGPVGLVIGSEGDGVGRLVKKNADFVVSLPMKGKINSLNASVAAGVICYEITRQRSGINSRNP